MRKFFVALALVAALSLTVYPVIPSLQAHVTPAVVVQHADYQQVAYDQSAPLIAAILSFILPGLGQIFLGELGRGILIFGLVVGLWIVSDVFYYYIPIVGPVFSCIAVGLWIWNIYDAYQLGIRKARGSDEDEDEDEDYDDEDEEGLLRPFYTPVHVFE